MTQTDLMTAPTLQPGQLIARGVTRQLAALGFASVEELVPTRGLRVDVMALGADFMSDSKWDGYLEWADRFFWAVDADFDVDLLPEDTGLFIGDSYGAELVRMGPETRLAAARRKKMTHLFATHAARRLHMLRDPHAMPQWG